MGNLCNIDYGVPAVDRSTILESNKELVIRILTIVDPLTSKLDENFKISSRTLAYDMIKKLAGLVHLLPASQYYHHAYAGGLFIHSLEVTIIALEKGIKESFDEEELFILFVMALIHDIGKLYCDISVKSNNGCQWLPEIETISAWLKRESVERYEFFHQMNRNKNVHKIHINRLSKYVISLDVFELIEKFDKKIAATFCENIKGKFYGKNPYHKIILDADSLSTINSFTKDIQNKVSEHVCSLPLLYTKLLLTYILNVEVVKSGDVIIENSKVLLEYNAFMNFVFGELKHNNILYPYNYKQLLEELIEYQFIEKKIEKCVRYEVKNNEVHSSPTGTHINMISKPIYFEICFRYGK